MSDVLAAIDDALSDHVTTAEQIGADLFAEAMDSVRDLIDGDAGMRDYATTATWVPPERKKPEPKKCTCPLCDAPWLRSPRRAARASPRPVVMGASPDFVIVDEAFEWATMVDGPSALRRPSDRFTIDAPFAGQTLEAMGIELPAGARLTYETAPILSRPITSAGTYELTQEDLARAVEHYRANWPTPEPP